jgi:hypothetical protein
MVRYNLPLWKVKDIALLMNECQEKEFDMIIFIEGNRGIGKSVLGWKLAKYCNSHFNPDRDLCYSRKEVIKQLSHKTKGIIFADEMINVAFKRDFYESDQKILIKGLNMYRDSFNILIGCIPAFTNLDTQLRDLCKLRISVIRRGLAIVHKQVNSQFTNDRWDTRNNQKIERNWSNSKTKKPNYAQLTTAVAFLKYKDMTPRDKERYLKIKHEKRNKIYADESLMDEDLQVKTFYHRLYEKLTAGELTMKMVNTLAEVYGVKRATLFSKVNKMLKEKGEGKTLTQYLRGYGVKKTKPKVKVKEIKWEI